MAASAADSRCAAVDDAAFADQVRWAEGVFATVNANTHDHKVDVKNIRTHARAVMLHIEQLEQQGRPEQAHALTRAYEVLIRRLCRQTGESGGAPATAPAPSRSPRPGWHALVVCSADYSQADRDLNPLLGAQVDYRSMCDALGEFGFHVTALLNAKAEAILSALDRFEAATEGAACALVYFSGHGVRLERETLQSQAAECWQRFPALCEALGLPKADEIVWHAEGLVPVDANARFSTELWGRDLGDRYDRLAAQCRQLIVVTDTCHADGACRLADARLPRGAPVDPVTGAPYAAAPAPLVCRADALGCRGWQRAVRDGCAALGQWGPGGPVPGPQSDYFAPLRMGRRRLEQHRGFLHIAACRADERANEDSAGGGLFTRYFVQQLRAAAAPAADGWPAVTISWQQLMVAVYDRLVAHLQQGGCRQVQTPILSGDPALQQRTVFRTTPAPFVPHTYALVEGTGVRAWPHELAGRSRLLGAAGEAYYTERDAASGLVQSCIATLPPPVPGASAACALAEVIYALHSDCDSPDLVALAEPYRTLRWGPGTPAEEVPPTPVRIWREGGRWCAEEQCPRPLLIPSAEDPFWLMNNLARAAQYRYMQRLSASLLARPLVQPPTDVVKDVWLCPRGCDYELRWPRGKPLKQRLCLECDEAELELRPAPSGHGIRRLECTAGTGHSARVHDIPVGTRTWELGIAAAETQVAVDLEIVDSEAVVYFLVFGRDASIVDFTSPETPTDRRYRQVLKITEMDEMLRVVVASRCLAFHRVLQRGFHGTDFEPLCRKDPRGGRAHVDYDRADNAAAPGPQRANVSMIDIYFGSRPRDALEGGEVPPPPPGRPAYA